MTAAESPRPGGPTGRGSRLKNGDTSAGSNPARGTTDRQPLATPEEVAAYLRIDPKTLENWRGQRKGPRFRRVGRFPRYRWSDVEAWLDQQTP